MALYAPPSAIRVELKYVDLAGASYVADTTGTLTLLATIAQGDTLQQRVGQRVMLTNLLIRGQVASGSTTATALATLIIVYDRQPQGALPAITDVLDASISNSFQRVDFRDRFFLCARWDFNLTGNSVTPATGGENIRLDFNVALRKPATYDQTATTGAIGTIRTGALYAITVGNNAAGTTAPNFTLVYRTSFADA